MQEALVAAAPVRPPPPRRGSVEEKEALFQESEPFAVVFACSFPARHGVARPRFISRRTGFSGVIPDSHGMQRLRSSFRTVSRRGGRRSSDSLMGCSMIAFHAPNPSFDVPVVVQSWAKSESGKSLCGRWLSLGGGRSSRAKYEWRSRR